MQLQSALDTEIGFLNCRDIPESGANTTTSEFTITTPALQLARAFFEAKENIFFQNALGYSWRCKFLKCWRCNSLSQDWLLMSSFEKNN
jgi:hypothetical protein